MPMNLHFDDSEKLGFPQPSRPMTEGMVPNPYLDGRTDTAEQYSTSDEPQEPERLVVDDDVTEVMGEFMEELNDEGRELFQKLLSNMAEKEITLERFVDEKIKDFRGGSISNLFEKFHVKLRDMLLNNSSGGGNDITYMERGVNNVDLMSTVDELKHKLERFKVKTVNLVIVKEEDKK